MLRISKFPIIPQAIIFTYTSHIEYTKRIDPKLNENVPVKAIDVKVGRRRNGNPKEASRVACNVDPKATARQRDTRLCECFLHRHRHGLIRVGFAISMLSCIELLPTSQTR